MKRYLFAIAGLCVGVAIGCHGQVPPTSHTVTLTITPPPGVSGYTYVVSRATATTTCPTPDITTPNYTPLNQSNPMTGTTYVDAAVAGQTVCYIAQSVVGGAVSGPSNTAGPFAVPANPTAPSIGGQSAKNEVPHPTLAQNDTQCGLHLFNGAVVVRDCTNVGMPQIHAEVR